MGVFFVIVKSFEKQGGTVLIKGPCKFLRPMGEEICKGFFVCVGAGVVTELSVKQRA